MALFRLSRFTLNSKPSASLIKTKFVHPIKPFSLSAIKRYASSAVIYKNGVGMISSEIDLPHNRYGLETTAPDNAIHGTLWVKSKSPNCLIESLEFVQGTTEEHRLCTTIPELLQANSNQIVEVKVGSEWVRGRVGQVLAQGSTPPGQKANGLLVLDTEKGHTTVNLGDVTSLKLPFHPPENLGEADQRLLTRMDRAFKVNRLRINYRMKRKEDATAIVSYATRGLCWAPSYRLDLDPKNKIGKMSMKSVIINDAQDLNADEVTCAVGLPVIRYSGVTEPLTSRGDIDTFLKTAGLDKDMASSIQEVGDGSSTTVSRDKTSDVFFYTFKNVSVIKGDRVSLPVFDEKDVTYTDLYYCKITGEEESNPKVLHSIKMKNSTETPWTTGPVMITENDKFIAHSNLSYSPVDGDALVKLAETLDVNVSYGVKTSGSDGQKVILGKKFKSFLDTGIVHARNLKDEPITVLISKDFYGDHINVDNNGKVTTHHLGNDINFKNTVKWELKLGPGESKELTHSFTFLQSSD